MIRETIIDSFKKLADYEFKSGNRFKGVAFRKSMVMISKSSTYKIEGDRITLINSDQTINVLGASSSKIFIDLVQTGHSERIDLIDIKSETNLEDLTNVSGIGEAKKSILISAGIDSVSKLYDLGLKIGDIIPGTNIRFTESISTGLKLFLRTKNERISHDQATEYCLDFKNNLIKNEIKNFEMYVLGSYRRNKPTVGDIDILLVPEDGKSIIGNIKSVVKNWFDAIFMDGDSKKAGIKGKTQVDVRFITRDELGAHILHGTGPSTFNQKIRGYVKGLGMKLNEKGIEKDGKMIKFDSERQIFKFLGLNYIAPSKRDDPFEVYRSGLR